MKLKRVRITPEQRMAKYRVAKSEKVATVSRKLVSAIGDLMSCQDEFAQLRAENPEFAQITEEMGLVDLPAAGQSAYHLTMNILIANAAQKRLVEGVGNV